MSSQRKLKVGQLGVGGWGNVRRATLRSSGLFDLVACYDINPEAMAKAQAQDGAKPTGSFDELLSFPGLDAVIISTGAKFHAEQVITACKRGLDVFVEKPLCSTPEEVRQLLDVQKSTGRVIGMGHANHAMHAVTAKMKAMMDEGSIGKVAAFEAVTCHSGGLCIKPGDWRGDPLKNPGGMLFQCGVHKFHELIYFFGPIKSVYAQLRYDVHTTQTADVAVVVVEFVSGVIGTLTAYHVTPYRHATTIYGTRSNLYWDGHYADRPPLHMQSLPPVMDGSFEPLVPVELPTEGMSEHGHLVSFYNAVTKGGVPYPSVIDGARAVTAVFAAEESAKLHRPVEVPQIQ